MKIIDTVPQLREDVKIVKRYEVAQKGRYGEQYLRELPAEAHKDNVAFIIKFDPNYHEEYVKGFFDPDFKPEKDAQITAEQLNLLLVRYLTKDQESKWVFKISGETV